MNYMDLREWSVADDGDSKQATAGSDEAAALGIEVIHEDVATDFGSYPEDGFAVTEDFDGKSFWMRSRNRLFCSELQELVADFADPKFLEIGCGNGSFLKYISDKVDAEITGSEVYFAGVLATQSKVGNIKLLQLDATRIPFSAEYDIIAAFDVLEHIDDDEMVMAGVHQALRSGGAFMISVPQYQWMWSDLDDLVHHRRRYRKRELTGKLVRAGFRVEYVTSHVFALFPLMVLSRMIAKLYRRKAGSMREFTEFSDTTNKILGAFMRIDEALIRRHVSLPFGGTLYAIARKSAA